MEITESLKAHRYFNMDIQELLELFMLLFNAEKNELMRRFVNRLTFYGELDFSNTIYNISDIIVYRYLYGDMSKAQRCFLTSSKFKDTPFYAKIKELTNKDTIK